VSFKRIINVLPGDGSENETYLILDGKAKKQASDSRRLSTKEVLPDKEKDWLPNVPIVARLRDFPFASLILEKHSELSSSGRVCIPVKQQ
jgi:hypothetical protein